MIVYNENECKIFWDKIKGNIYFQNKKQKKYYIGNFQNNVLKLENTETLFENDNKSNYTWLHQSYVIPRMLKEYIFNCNSIISVRIDKDIYISKIPIQGFSLDEEEIYYAIPLKDFYIKD